VHLWRVALAPSAAVLARVERHLAPDERDRAARFRFSEHREAFLVGRGAQREILARYTGTQPGEIAYHTSPHGKLALAGSGATAGLRFNVSNSGALALIAVARVREVGVDVEHVRPIPDGMEIAARFFSAPENRAFAALDEAERDEAFFHCWTRKEAYIKAVGEGLSMPLDRFDVAFAPGESARLLATRGDPAEAERWTMAAVEPGAGYVGALVVEGREWVLSLLQWEPEAG
jgi:4'-phosphopantetheinyl transferase